MNNDNKPYNMQDDSEWLKTIRQVPIMDYAEKIGLHPHMLGSRYAGIGGGHKKDDYDSVRIDTQKNCFYRNSNGRSGGIIDFAMEFGNCDTAKEAMHEIARIYGIETKAESKMNGDYKPKASYSYVPHTTTQSEVSTPKKLEYPPRAESMKKAWHYLVDERKIEPSVVEYFRRRGMLYQDTKDNAVFCTKDYACKRSTGQTRFVGDAVGCNYKEGFFFNGKSVDDKPIDKLFVAESVIDIMSVMSYRAIKNQQYSENSSYLALGGTQKTDCIFNQLDKNPDIKTVYLCLDNDESGKSATENIKNKITNDYPNVKAVEAYAPRGKDWNEFIVYLHNFDRQQDEPKNQVTMNEVQKDISEKKANEPIEHNSDKINSKDKGAR